MLPEQLQMNQSFGGFGDALHSQKYEARRSEFANGNGIADVTRGNHSGTARMIESTEFVSMILILRSMTIPLAQLRCRDTVWTVGGVTVVRYVHESKGKPFDSSLPVTKQAKGVGRPQSDRR